MVSRSNNLCEICFTNPTNSYVSCDHSFCSSCLEFYLYSKIIDAEVFDLNCPRCNNSLTIEEIKSLTNEELFGRYQRFLSVKELLKNPYARLCPQPDCKGFDIASASKRKLICKMCAYRYCYGCSNGWHNGKCKFSTDSKFSSWAKKQNAKLCPRCRSYVLRNGGCSHMICSKCGSSWCWICGYEFGKKHTERSCLIGRQINDCYWSSILVFLFFPISYFFMFFILVRYQIEVEGVPFQCCLKYRFVNKLISFVLSPIMSFIVFPLFMAFVFLNFIANKTCFGDLENRFSRYFFFMFIAFLFIFVYPASFAIYIGLGILLSVFLPVLGLVLLILKIVTISKNFVSKDD